MILKVKGCGTGTVRYSTVITHHNRYHGTVRVLYGTRYRYWYNSTGTVRVPVQYTYRYFCSGLFLSPDLILTLRYRYWYYSFHFDETTIQKFLSCLKMSSRNGYDALSTEADQRNESPDGNTGSDECKEKNFIALTSRKEVDFRASGSQEEEIEYVEVIVLDSAQNRFSVHAHPSWTVKRLKEVSQQIHKVHPLSQRLIFRGRMLEDYVSLQDAGIVDSGVIIHLVCSSNLIVGYFRLQCLN